MKTILALVLLVPSLSYGLDIKLKPGKWNVKMFMIEGGKKKDPMAELRAQLEKLPAKEREAMMGMMKGQAEISEKGTGVCYSEDSFKQGKFGNQDPNCDVKVNEETKSSIKMSYSCKNGSKGDSNWKIHSDEHITGTLEATDEKGKAHSFEQELTFDNKDCGALKPL